jgi:hypothetical protein
MKPSDHQVDHLFYCRCSYDDTEGVDDCPDCDEWCQPDDMLQQLTDEEMDQWAFLNNESP